MHRQGEEAVGVPLLEHPEVLVALVTFATVGVELVREVLHRRDRLVQGDHGRSLVLEVGVLQGEAESPTRGLLGIDVIERPVFTIRDFES
jgi:hypothetical protein